MKEMMFMEKNDNLSIDPIEQDDANEKDEVKNEVQTAEQEVSKTAILKELIEIGKAKGNLTNQEIIDILDDIDIDVEQIEKLYETLEGMGVEIINDFDDDLIEDAIFRDDQQEIDVALSAEGISIDDPVRMYLKEIGRVSLLTTDEFLKPAAKSRIQILWKFTKNSFSRWQDSNG